MREAYPEHDAWDVRTLEVSGGHRLYVEQSGNPKGLPVIFLHGGPGSGAGPHHRSYFCPRRYRVVIFDQRGAGRSRPLGLLAENTTADLVADMERIRLLLGIDRWVLFGGSWGVTLALAYALAYPQRVRGMVLRGCFLGRPEDVEWFASGSLERFFPEAWASLIKTLPEGAPLDGLIRCILGKDQVLALRVARAWAHWSGTVVRYALPAGVQDEEGDETPDEVVLAQARIEMHYAAHGYFLGSHGLLERAAQLPRVPVIIVHGRRDLTCVPRCSWLLHQAIPSELVYVHDAGHLASEPAMTEALVAATDRMAEQA